MKALVYKKTFCLVIICCFILEGCLIALVFMKLISLVGKGP